MAAIAPKRPRVPETLKLVATFLAVTTAVAGLGYAAAWMTGLTLTVSGGVFVRSCLAWSPGFGAIVTLRLHGQLQSWDFGLRRARRRFALFAIAIPALVMSVVYGSVWISGLAAFAVRGDRPSFIGVPMLALAGSGLGIFLGAAGEELGWRGLLVPLLARSCDFPAVVWISWVCWFIYRLPAILPARDQGAAPFAFRLVAFGTMLLALSIMLAWLRLRSASLWPAILLHAAHNFFIQDIFDPLTAANPQSVWITGEFGAGAAAAYLPLAWILLVNGTRSHGGHGHTA
jgi:membrane protease YdiL (CAAX protease family)